MSHFMNVDYCKSFNNKIISENLSVSKILWFSSQNSINHFTAMAITKLDVMDTFETVCACVGYLDKEGNEIDYMPASIKKLGEVTAKIQEFPGWMTDTTKCSQVFLQIITT